jgi:hypothetical protein
VLLRNTLTAAGYDAVIIWAGIGRNRILGQIKAPVKRRLLALPSVGPWAGLRDRITQTGEQKSGLKTDRKQPQRRGFWLDLVTIVWATIVTLVNILALRRKVLRSLGSRRVIIFDRYTLDSAVKLRHWYGDTWATQLLTGAIHHTTTRPLRAYFLDVAPQVAFDRKHEWDLDDLTCRAVLYHEEYAGLGVRRLDGTRTVTDLNAEIAAEVWQSLQ